MKSDFNISDGVLCISDGVIELEDQQFAERDDFRKVVLPDTLRILGTEVFSCCNELEEVVFPETLQAIGVADFAYCPKLAKVKLPEALRSIGEGAFLGCESLRNVVLPDSLEEICDMAFFETAIEKISVPASVKSIGESAFWSCENLRRADVLGKDTFIDSDAFGSCYELAEGYIAPGFPQQDGSPAAELLYSLLWCTCPQKHGAEVSGRAKRFIAKEESLIMERVFSQGNIAALTTLSKQRLLKKENIESYICKANADGMTQMTALLLNAKGAERFDEGEFEL